jgi:hypothetical protein
VGLEAIELAKKIMEREYSDWRELDRDLEYLADTVDFYLNWD